MLHMDYRNDYIYCILMDLDGMIHYRETQIV